MNRRNKIIGICCLLAVIRLMARPQNTTITTTEVSKGMINIPRPVSTAPVATYNGPLPHWRTTLNAYLDQHKLIPDRAWLIGFEGPQQVQDNVARYAPNLIGLLKPYRSIDPLAKRIFNQFKQSRWAVVIPGPSGPMQGNPILAVRQPEGPQVIGVTWIPQAYWRDPIFQNVNFAYHAPHRSIDATAVLWPEATLTARLYHEMGHALYHQVDHAPSADAAMMSDSWIQEEVVMHCLETKVLQAASNDRFFPFLAEIIKRTPATMPYEERRAAVYESVTADDLRAYDNLFGLNQSGAKTSGTHLSQFLFALGIRLIKSSFPEDEQIDRLVEFYRWQHNTKAEMGLR